MKNTKRQAATDRWRAIAAGNFEEDTRAWLTEVAKALLAANEETDPNDFRMAITRAVGFTGNRGAKWDDIIRMLDAHGLTPGASGTDRRDQLRVCVRALRAPDTASDGAIDAQIRRALRG